MSPTKVDASEVKALRERTGAPMMDCKAALAEADGDMDKAVEILRVKGAASAEKRSGRGTGEGYVASYSHATGKVGVLLELQCETDFVANNEEFREFAREIAIHVAAMAPAYVSVEDIPEAERDAERKVLEEKAKEEGKPAEVVEKMIAGQIGKWEKELVLLSQQHFNADKHGDKTIEELRTEVAAKTGENVRIARFARFAIGEGD